MTTSSMITHVAHLGIRVHDLARSRAFYEQLGFEFIAGPISFEPVAILRHPSGVEINLILNAAESTDRNILMDIETKHAGYTHVAFAIQDLDAAQAMLSAANIKVSEGPVQYPGGAQGLFLRDPDLNVIELYLPAKKIST